MDKKKVLTVILIIIAVLLFAVFIFTPKSIESALKRIDEPFKVGEIFTVEDMGDDLYFAIYRNEDNINLLQNAVLKKSCVFYKVIDENGSLNFNPPKDGNDSKLKSTGFISWYDKKHPEKYVIMVAAYDNAIDSVEFCGKKLEKIEDRKSVV